MDIISKRFIFLGFSGALVVLSLVLGKAKPQEDLSKVAESIFK